MHKIHSKAFTADDFSHEHMDAWSLLTLNMIIQRLNEARDAYIENSKSGDTEEAKIDWWQMIQLLPSSYNQRRTIKLNYAVLKNIYNARKNHKLDEWHVFCDWIKTLPYAMELICLK